MRPLFIGEAPSPTTSRFGSHPLVGMTGTRLAQWAGLSPAGFRRRVECVNLFDALPRRWNHLEAREQALKLYEERFVTGMQVVLLGEKVARAFGAGKLKHYRWAQVGPMGDMLLVVMPHPSGLNHHWNNPRNVLRAEAFLHRLLEVRRRPRQSRLPML